MLPYYFLFILAASFALTRIRPVGPNIKTNHWSSSWWMMFVLLTLMIGLRHEVGGDWVSYLSHIEQITNEPFAVALRGKDPASSVLNWLGSHWGGVYLVNSVCGALFTWGLIVFCRAQPLPWLALLVAVPYLVMVVAMGYTRQGVAIGLAMLALVAIDKGKVMHFVAWIAVAALFHKSAVILVPLAILAGSKRKLWTLLWVGVAGTSLFFLLLQESLDFLAYGYLEQEYQSSGAGIRIAMNALPAVVFLMLRKRFLLAANQKKFWTWMAIGALGFVGLLYVSPSSTAVDRVALYWIPLQLFVLARLPIAMGHKLGGKNVWIRFVVAYSAAVQIVWLVFAETAFAWLPYKFYPWVAIWN